jgi:hypothetical protein
MVNLAAGRKVGNTILIGLRMIRADAAALDGPQIDGIVALFHLFAGSLQHCENIKHRPHPFIKKNAGEPVTVRHPPLGSNQWNRRNVPPGGNRSSRPPPKINASLPARV